jgi:hypothetical protein
MRAGWFSRARSAGVAGIVAATLTAPSSEKKALFCTTSNEKFSGSVNSPFGIFSFIVYRRFF